jgi:predicted extracellular nuclease
MRMSRSDLSGKRRVRIAALSAAALTVPFAATPAAHAVSADVVISEVYGGGGNSGAPYANDFVELHNRGGSSVSLAGWSVQYASASGSSWLVTALSGSIAAGGSYLVKLASGGSAGAALPTPDATGTTNLSATAGKVGLRTSATALTCSTGCATATGVRDFLGYGSASSYEGSPAPAGSNTNSLARTNPATDTDNNAADFATGAPTPQNSAGGGGTDCSGYTGTRIRDIQGAAHVSPKNGTAVTNVRGVVTAVKSTGFWYQDPCPDSDVATSEGVLVFTSSAPTVAVGNEISVNATVSEYRPSSSPSALSVTELTQPTITKLGTRALPAPIVIGTGGRVPPSSVIEDDANGSVETGGVFDPATDGIDFYESLEGMRVQVNNPVAVGPYNATYGEIPVIGDNGANAGVRTGRGGIVLRQNDHNPERITLDDAVLAGSTPAGVNVGDHFSGPAVGPLDYTAGMFMLELTSPLTRVAGPITKETTTATPAGELSVATFNVENLAPTDPQSKFDGLANVVVDNLKAPDILAIEEIQDDSGATDDGTVSAGQTWAKFISAISSAGGPTYTYRQIDPVNNADGGQPGGNIRQGFLFRTDVSGLSFAPGTAGGSTQAVGVTSTGNSADPVGLTVNPGRISPTDSAFNASRKPLIGKFLFGGKPVFVIANHFNSKGGDDYEWGRYQPPNESSVTQRVSQATIVAGFVKQITAIDSGARIVVAGDLNDYEFSTAVKTLVNAGLADLPATLPDAERYTYDFEGNSQVLDHIMLSPALSGAAHGYDVVHVNSEFADQVSDHEPQVADLTVP